MTFTASTFRPLSLAVSLMLGVAPAAFAQEAAKPATEAPAAAAPADAAPAAETPAAPAAEAPAAAAAADAPAQDDAVGQPYVKANFDAWEQRCIKTAENADPCQLYQLLKDGEGTAVAEFSMFNLPAGGQAVAGATIIVPLETLLTENLQLVVDSGKPRVYPFTFCAQMGCVARVGFTAEDLTQFKKGNKATVTIVPMVAADQKVSVEVSLKGFTAGFKAVEEANVASQK